jgi:hypothetical protein
VTYKLLVKDGAGEREMLLVGIIAVGRDPRCDISDANPLLSRRHAEFLPSDRGVLVRDLNSRNGILVNGRRVLEAVLQPGDVVQVAHIAVTLVSSTAPLADTMPAPVPLHYGSPFAVAPSVAAVASGRPAPAMPETQSGASILADDDTSVNSAHAVASTAIRADEQPATVSDNASRKSGAWSVLVAQDDDRTRSVAPPAEVLEGRGESEASPAAPGAGVSGGVRPEAAAPGLPDGAVPAPAEAVVVPLALDRAPLAPGPAVGVTAGPRVRTPALGWTARAAILVAGLAAVGFGSGVASTLLALGPSTGVTGLRTGEGAAAMAGGLAVALVAAVLAALALWRMTLGALAVWAAQLHDHAATGRGPVADPLNAGATRRVTQTVNALLDRTRTPVA